MSFAVRGNDIFAHCDRCGWGIRTPDGYCGKCQRPTHVITAIGAIYRIGRKSLVLEPSTGVREME